MAAARWQPRARTAPPVAAPLAGSRPAAAPPLPDRHGFGGGARGNWRAPSDEVLEHLCMPVVREALEEDAAAVEAVWEAVAAEGEWIGTELPLRTDWQERFRGAVASAAVSWTIAEVESVVGRCGVRAGGAWGRTPRHGDSRQPPWPRAWATSARRRHPVVDRPPVPQGHLGGVAPQREGSSALPRRRVRGRGLLQAALPTEERSALGCGWDGTCARSNVTDEAVEPRFAGVG